MGKENTIEEERANVSIWQGQFIFHKLFIVIYLVTTITHSLAHYYH